MDKLYMREPLNESKMRGVVDRILSIAVAFAAVTVAVVLVHREFFSTPSKRSPVTREPEFVANWRDILPAARIVGDTQARVHIIEFTDLECPFCREFHGSMQMALRKYPKDLTLAFVHFPLRNHRFAIPAARAAECAHEQGKFTQFVDRVFQKQDSLGLKTWTSFAHASDISDTLAFDRCVMKAEKPALVEAGMSMGDRFSVRGTPTIIINGWRLTSPPSDDELARVIDALLAGKEPYPRQD